MKNDKQLLKELVEYLDDVMVDVEEGKPFEKVEVPDYRGHELEFRIDMLIEQFQDMMNNLLYYKEFFHTYQNGTDEGICWPNIKELLEKLEKECKNKNNKQIEKKHE